MIVSERWTDDISKEMTNDTAGQLCAHNSNLLIIISCRLNQMKLKTCLTIQPKNGLGLFYSSRRNVGQL